MMEERKIIKTYKYRVRDKHSAHLNRLARKVNLVWNFLNDSQKHALKWGKKWPNWLDLEKLTTGSSKELGLQSKIIGQICKQYAQSRQQNRKPYLRYRGQKSLGWVPMRGEAIKLRPDGFRCHGNLYSVWLSRPIPEGAKVCDRSSFSQDATGNWYLNLIIEILVSATEKTSQIGIDLGLKDLATLSDGNVIVMPGYYRKSQDKLAKAQRAKKKRQIKKIHAKIANQRKDYLHKVSTDIVRQHGFIAVGNVNSSALKQTRMAKSVSDAGWSSFRSMLAYKSDYAGARYVEVNESFTTQICSQCGSLSGPKGIADLGIREWKCDCGATHNRDVNAAKNILRLGCQTLAEGMAA